MADNIKLIVCDVDGTLLMKDETILHPRTADAINQLVEKGHCFAVASGRSYPELLQIFSSVRDEIYYICLDGALVIKDGKTLFSTPIFEPTLDKVVSFENETVFIGKYNRFMPNEVCEEVYKIDVPYSLSANRLFNYIRNNRLLKQVYDGSGRIEFVSPGTDKGSAVRFLQKTLNIEKKNTIAFGDNLNDIEMLKCAGLSYSANNAKRDIRLLAKYHTDNVTEEIMNIQRRER